MFTEGFNSAITAVPDDPMTMEVDEDESDIDSLVLNFRGIPDGVTVTASMEGTGMPMEVDGSDLAPLMLVTGEDEGADEDGIVRSVICRRGGGHVQVRHWQPGGSHDGRTVAK